MKLHNALICGCAGLLLVGTAHAASITCGHATITDDQPEAQTTQQVRDKCGEPTAKNGSDWIYDRSDVGQGVYVLHFNGSGQLESIKEKPKQ